MRVKTGRTKNCTECGKEFYRPPSLDKITRCSYKCMGKSTSRRMKGKLPDHLKGLQTKENHWNWKGGVTDARRADMSSEAYRVWRRQVFMRDGFDCQLCGEHGTKLNPVHAHHIKRWADFPDLRYETSNGVTLCRGCHYITHSKPAEVEFWRTT